MRPVSIEGYTHYSVSEEGVVQNTLTGKVLRTDLNSSGYRRVTLSSSCGKGLLRIFVHKLVAIVYLGDLSDTLVVNHIDCNKLNNHYKNLEWVTQGENRKHAFKNKLCRRPNSKLSDTDVKNICSCIQSGVKAKEIRKVFNIPKHVYDDIRSRRYYKDISDNYIW